jgi:proline iminopeptidase
MLAKVNPTTELSYTTHGSGPLPIIVVHGLGLDHQTLRPWFDSLESHGTIVYYDQRGHGQSAKNDPTLTVEEWVQDLEGLRATLGHDRFVLAGHSTGSMIALEYAARFSYRLRGLLLVGAAPALDYPDVILAGVRERGSDDEVATVEGLLAAGPQDDTTLRERLLSILPLFFHKFDPGVIGPLIRGLDVTAQAWRAAWASLGGWSVMDRASEIRCPTLITAGRHDWLTPVGQAERLAAELPYGTLEIFETSGHFPYIEEAARWSSVVNTWLDPLG